MILTSPSLPFCLPGFFLGSKPALVSTAWNCPGGSSETYEAMGWGWLLNRWLLGLTGSMVVEMVPLKGGLGSI